MQREIDAEIEAKNVGAALGIPLAVVMLLIQKAKADELDDAREVFAHARPAVVSEPVPLDTAEGEDDDLDDNDYGYDDDGEEVYDEGDDYDPDDDQNDDQNEDDSHDFQMKLW